MFSYSFLVIIFRNTIVYYTFDILSNKSGPGSCHVEKFNVSSCCKKKQKILRQGKVTNKIWETTSFGGFFSGRGAILTPHGLSVIGGNKRQKVKILKFRMWFKYWLKGQKLLAQGIARKQHALKGQKLLAQGIALGIMAISKAPCKGNSFIYCLKF